MASVKVVQLCRLLHAYASLYANAGARPEAEALLSLSRALAKAEKIGVDELVSILSKGGQVPAKSRKLSASH